MMKKIIMEDIMKKNKILSIIIEYEKLKEKANKLLDWYNKEVEPVPGIKYLECTEIDKEFICYEGEETWNYGGRENHYFELPAELLYNELLKQKMIEDKKKEIENKKAEELREQERQKEKELKKDLEDMKRLQKKYGIELLNFNGEDNEIQNKK